MVWQHTPFTIPLILATAIAVGSACLLLWRRHHIPSSRTAAVLLFAAAAWILAYALELASRNLPAMIFWDKVQFLGRCIIPLAWLIYTLQYTGRAKWLTRRNLAVLSIAPLLVLLLAFTTEAHGPIWSDIRLDTDGPFAVNESAWGIGMWAYIAYAYTLVAIGILLLIQALIRSGRLYRWQGTALLIAVIAPWAANIITEILGLRVGPRLELTPLTLCVTVPIVAWSLYRLRTRDIVPVAHDSIIENLSDGVLILDMDGQIVDLNVCAQRLIGQPRSKVIRRPLAKVWSEWPRGLEFSAKDSKALVLGDGEERRTYDVGISSLADWRGRPISRAIVLRDITERVRVEELIQTSLAEKEVLLQEVHHRVKNNLQVISSLLSLQSRAVTDEQALEILKDSQTRVRSMALIHEKLYQSESLSQIDFADYTRNLTAHLFRTYSASVDGIELTINAQDVFLGVTTAVPCGLVLNELISNALKHAFPNGRAGEIRVGLCTDDARRVTLQVADNGVGLPPDLDFRDTTSLGLRLINNLVDQLEGTLELNRSEGTAFEITFAAG